MRSGTYFTNDGNLTITERGDETRIVVKYGDNTLIARLTQDEVRDLLSSDSVEPSSEYVLQNSYSINKVVFCREEYKLLLFYGDETKEVGLFDFEWERLIADISVGIIHPIAKG
jgi:hypothetical protein